MKPKHAKRLKVGDSVKRIFDSAHPALCDRGEVIAHTTRSVSVKWLDVKKPWEVFYFSDAFAMQRLALDTIPRS